MTPAWMASAECRNAPDKRIFFPAPNDNHEPAFVYCRRCPVLSRMPQPRPHPNLPGVRRLRRHGHQRTQTRSTTTSSPTTNARGDVRMTVEYDSLTKLVDACRTLDAHGIGWAAAALSTPNPFGVGDTITYRLYASEKVPT